MYPAPFARLTMIEGPEVGTEYSLTEQRIILGRDAGATVRIQADGVSREHALLLSDLSGIYIEDQNSSNGTFVNGVRISGRTRLNNLDRIALGKHLVLRFELAEPADPGATLLEQAGVQTLLENQPGEATANLTFQVGAAPPQTIPLVKAVTTIGRSPDNDVAIGLPFVSRQHARILLADGRFQLQILAGSANPVYVNERLVNDSQALLGGECIRIGSASSGNTIELQFALADAATVPNMRVQAAPAATGPAGTLLIDPQQPVPTSPPRLLVTVAGAPEQSYTLDRAEYSIGRASSNDIVINSPIVSRQHAVLVRKGAGYAVRPAGELSNPLLHNGRPLTAPLTLRHKDALRIGSNDPGVMVSLSYQSPSETAAAIQPIEMREQATLTIGRHPDNDIVLDSPVVSHFHAQIERVGQRFRVRDLRSSNGTFLNDEPITNEVWLKPDDEIRIGNHRFTVGEGQISQVDESSGLEVVARGLQKWVRKDLNILQDISLTFRPKEFIVVVGQSGGGKSTLVDAIAGYRPATHGQVTVNGIDVYKNFDAIRNEIGFVPQKDLIHMELSVFEALDYTARLRMPPETTKAERHQRVHEVLADLDLTHRKDVPVSGLSGGQQKRVSIGLELLTKPGLFFLDEPTSGLDPGTETALMQLMRRLADQGRTIVLITHATKNVMLADKVVFLARGGYLCWFGPPDEALAYFDQYRTERERRSRPIEFDDVYAILDDPARGSPAEWASRFQQHPAHDEYVGDTAAPQAAPVTARPKRSRNAGALRQFIILSQRNIRILTRDRFSLLLMLAAAPLVSLLDVILAVTVGNNPFEYVWGTLPDVMITLLLPAVYGVMVGGISQMREIVKEQEIYKRERLVNLKILPYVSSKIWVAAILAFYQTIAYVVVHYLAFEMPGGPLEFALIYFSLALATMGGMMLGLFASALAPTPNSAPLIVILFMLPQIVLSGALLPLPSYVTAPISTRWAFQASMAITGPGSDVAADACWALPPEERGQLPREFKNENCRCLGVNIVKQDSCYFPGVGRFYNGAIDQPPPVEPPPLRAEPAEPIFPPQPVEPEDQADQVAFAEYLAALEAWQAEVEIIQAGYEEEINAFRLDAEQFQTNMIAYQTDLARWQIDRAAAIEPAEGYVSELHGLYGWTFVNQEETVTYYGTILRTWLAQLLIISALFVGILILQRRKDVV